jgi:RNA polymerase sigma-70 factor (ECF subfamily)
LSADEKFLALLAQHRSGDPRALNAMMVALYPAIHRIISRLAWSLRASCGHEDLVQNALEQVCRSIHTFEGRSRLSTFVFGICHKVVARSRRYERVRSWFKRDAEEACLPQAPTSPDELLDRARHVHDARGALARLGAEERAAFVLHEVEDLPLAEVAIALECSTRTVKRRLSAARTKLLAPV